MDLFECKRRLEVLALTLSPKISYLLVLKEEKPEKECEIFVQIYKFHKIS